MSDQLLVVLRVLLLVLVYLVFLRVLRAVWVELRAEAPRPAGERVRVPAAAPAGPAPAGPTTPASRGGGSGAVVGIQLLAPASLAGMAYRIEGETTIGRAAGCGIPIDDPHISKLHARVFPSGDRWYVEDLGSTNGTMVNGSVIVAAAPVGPGDRVQVGDVVMELV